MPIPNGFANKARSECLSILVAHHREEFNRLMTERYAREGFTYVPRANGVEVREKRREAIAEALRNDPSLAELVKSQI